MNNRINEENNEFLSKAHDAPAGFCIGLRGEDTRSFLAQKRLASFQIFCENPVLERLLRSIFLSLHGCRSTILKKTEKLEKISKK